MFRKVSLFAALLVFGAAAGLVSSAQAQCSGWLPDFPYPGITGDVRDMIEWDPDGPGPRTPLYVFGGKFTLAGGSSVRNIATLDPLTGEWDDMAGGITGSSSDASVYTLAVLPTGELLAGGNFGRAGDVNAPYIAIWNGSIWSPFGPRLDSAVQDIAITPSGDLYIAGPYRQQGPPERLLRWVAKWDGTQWFPLGSGADNVVRVLHAMPNGDLIAGGQFNNAGGVSSPRIARWDGSNWHRIAAGGDVFAITSLPNGDIIAGGAFVSAGGTTVNRVARWDGLQWNALGNGFDKPVNALSILANGDIAAGGEFLATGTLACRGAAQWNGSAWSPLGGGVSNVVYTLSIVSDSVLLVGGRFAHAGGSPYQNWARWSADGRAPVIRHPEGASLDAGDTLTLSATPATGYLNVTVHWQRNGVDIVDGPGGSSPGGGTVSGANGILASPTDGAAATLTITNAKASDAGEYAAIFSNACGSTTSNIAQCVIAPCPSDYTGDTLVDILDFLDFFQDFGTCDQLPSPCGTLGNPDVNGDTIIDILDFLDFLDAFGNGC